MIATIQSLEMFQSDLQYDKKTSILTLKIKSSKYLFPKKLVWFHMHSLNPPVFLKLLSYVPLSRAQVALH